MTKPKRRKKQDPGTTYIADLETVVYDGQDTTEAWASALIQIDMPDEPEFVLIHHSLDETLYYLSQRKENATLYYHNLKFDGEFWMYFLLHDMHFEQALFQDDEGNYHYEKASDLKNNQVVTCISDMGEWYTITFKYKGCVITLKDSLKLLPFSVATIGKSFKTKHQKLTMEYKGKRYAGCEITPEEQSYIANDVLVMKEALQIMFEQGHDSLTIGSCCLDEYKSIVGKYDYRQMFPRLDLIELDPEEYGASNADEYIRKSYRGGWCYLVKGAENKDYHNGTTADVNSLYPSMMSSQSGNKYPRGKPCFFKGDVPERCIKLGGYYFLRIKCRFYLKKGYLPFIQIKGNRLYRSTQMLETSDIYDKKTGRYYSQYTDPEGNLHDTAVTMTVTCTDWELIKEHYILKDLEILDGCWFFAESGMFDDYIEKYKQIKMTSKGALRQIAKLFLNNLYGKLATSPISSFKYAMLDDNDLHFKIQVEEDKEPVYIAAGSAITSYSRNFTIRAAQKNFHGANKPGFKYADTDSIHCDLPPEKIEGIRVDDNDFCAWKLEACWDFAKFIRQKTYVEHVTHEDLKPIDEPYYNIKCAGMPENCKKLFLSSITQNYNESDYKPDELEFLKTKRTFEDFRIGLCIPGKLLPKRIPGGVILEETEFTMRELCL